MKQIKINRLELKNFKGIKEFDLNINGKNVSIYGDNGVGKTTIFDSFMWLLFDKDSANSSNFNIKTLDEYNNPVHKLEHSVLVELEIDKQVIVLQKVYKEKWTRRRGEAEETLTGHTTDYFINEMPKKKKEYEDYLSNLIDEDTFRILTNPLYFNADLHWKDRRNIALELCDSVSDEEVLNDNEQLESLREYLTEGVRVDDLKISMNSKRKNLNEELKDIPGRIDELSKSVDIDIDIKALEEEKRALQEQIDEIKTENKDTIELRIRSIVGSIKILENELTELEQDSKRDLNSKLDELTEESRAFKNKRNKLEYEKTILENNLKLNKENIETLISNREYLSERWYEEKEKEFNQEDTICPTCSQPLQADRISRMIENFDKNKEETIKTINEKGKTIASQIEKIEVTIDHTVKRIKELEKEIAELNTKLDAKLKELKKVKSELENIDVSNNTSYKEKQSKLKELKEEVKVLEEKIAVDSSKKRIVELEEKIDLINKKIALVDIAKDNEKRIKELAKEQRELAQEIADIEKIEFLIDEFTMLKANLLEDNLNSKFDLVKFKLFDEVLSGGIKETFVTTVAGVPFEDLNNAMKINAGLDIIKTLSEHYEVQAPIFLDNRESINEIPDMDTQIVNLIVSKHKALNVKIKEED